MYISFGIKCADKAKHIMHILLMIIIPSILYCTARFNKNKSLKLAKTAPGKNGKRWYKNVGLGFKTPKEAIEGDYIDKKCPFTGNVSIRGRILTGIVHKAKMNRTIVVRFNYLHYGMFCCESNSKLRTCVCMQATVT